MLDGRARLDGNRIAGLELDVLAFYLNVAVGRRDADARKGVYLHVAHRTLYQHRARRAVQVYLVQPHAVADGHAPRHAPAPVHILKQRRKVRRGPIAANHLQSGDEALEEARPVDAVIERDRVPVRRRDALVGQPSPLFVATGREQESRDVGALHVAFLKADHHLVALFGLELHAGAVCSEGQRHADPRRGIFFVGISVRFGLPGKLNAHPAKFLGVEIVGDKCQLRLRLTDHDVGQSRRNGRLAIELHADHLLTLVVGSLLRIVGVDELTTAVHAYHDIILAVDLDLVTYRQFLGVIAEIQIDGILAHLLLRFAHQTIEFGIHVDVFTAEVILGFLVFHRAKLPDRVSALLVALIRPGVDVRLLVLVVQVFHRHDRLRHPECVVGHPVADERCKRCIPQKHRDAVHQVRAEIVHLRLPVRVLRLHFVQIVVGAQGIAVALLVIIWSSVPFQVVVAVAGSLHSFL